MGFSAVLRYNLSVRHKSPKRFCVKPEDYD